MKAFQIMVLAASLAVPIGWASPVSAGEGVPAKPTFTRDVLPILQQNCQSCHRPSAAGLSGMIAPMSLVRYQEVRPWAKAIARAVASRAMPPWHASSATAGVFRNERTLTQQEIDTLVAWVKLGAARGKASDSPPPRKFNQGEWAIGEPDLIIGFDEPYWVADDVEDIQPRIELKLKPGDIDSTKWVKAIEFKPGSEVVHHMVGYVYVKGMEGQTTPESRYIFGRAAPGTDAQYYPENFGIPLEPEATISMGMHYHKEVGPGTGTWDSSQIGVKFHDKPVAHPVASAPISYGPFEIPPFHPEWAVGAAYTVTEDIIILDLLPHMHLRGKSARYTAIYPDGTREVLLDVPNYDYNWQTGYEYKEFKSIPAGTRIEWEMTFDNSRELADITGVNPARPVRFGGPTTDEMDLGWITYAMQEENKKPFRITRPRRRAEGTD